MSAPRVCPLCGQSQRVAKVNALYIAGIEAGRSGSTAGGRLPAGISLEELRALSKRLSPPASRKEVQLRLVHPDLVVVAFSLIVPVFLSGIYSRQPGFFWPAIVMVLLAYGVYFWQRQFVLSRFDRQVQAERDKHERIRRGVQRWMGLYYCAEDDIVFIPGGAPPVPADQMPGYLLQD